MILPTRVGISVMNILTMLKIQTSTISYIIHIKDIIHIKESNNVNPPLSMPIPRYAIHPSTMQDFETVQCFEDTLIVPLVTLTSPTKVSLVDFYTAKFHQLA